MVGSRLWELSRCRWQYLFPAPRCSAHASKARTEGGLVSDVREGGRVTSWLTVRTHGKGGVCRHKGRGLRMA